MSAQTFLPKEPLKLPTDLPLEIPAHADAGLRPGSAHAEHGYPAKPPTEHFASPVKTILSWQAPGRPFRKRSKEYFMSVLLITVLVEIVLFLFSEYMLMAAVFSLMFLAFALATVPPPNFHYKISNQGLTIEDHFYLWEELYDFYFKRRDGISIVHVRTQAVLPGELTLTLGDMDQEHVKSVLARFIPYREIVKPTFMEKSGDWLARNFPLEKNPPKTT